jgi:hypothetical protein
VSRVRIFCHIHRQFFVEKRKRNITGVANKPSALILELNSVIVVNKIMGSTRGLLCLSWRTETVGSRWEEIFTFWNINDVMRTRKP